MEDEMEELKKLVKKEEYTAISDKAKDIHPHDLAEFLHSLDREKMIKVLLILDHAVLIELLPELPEEMQLEYVMELPPKKAAELLIEIPPDEMADVLGDLSIDIRKKIVDYFTGEKTKEARDLLEYHEDTAGGLMTTEVVALPSEMTCAETEEYIREKATEYETIYYIYVTEGQKLVGVLSLRDLVLSRPNSKLMDIMNPDVIMVLATLDQEEVARIIADYDLIAVPVVDEGGRLLGIVTVDDVIDVIDQETTEDIARLSGVTTEIDKLIEARVPTVVKARLPWLVMTLFGGLLSGAVIVFFEKTIATIVALAVFIPLIMGMGGNVGTQSSTVYIRGLATKEVGNKFSYFLREIPVGMLMGLAIGTGVGLAALMWMDSPILGFVVGVSMFFAVTVASIMGVLAPSIFDRLGIDPAITAGPLITTASDITGLIIYFSLATLLLHYMV
ncbi:MAG: magnesium transporter [Candidatus Hydrothermarchaeaceae archaeon]